MSTARNLATFLAQLGRVVEETQRVLEELEASLPEQLEIGWSLSRRWPSISSFDAKAGEYLIFFHQDGEAYASLDERTNELRSHQEVAW